MKNTEFKKGLFEVLQQRGFIRSDGLVQLSGDGASVYVGVQKGFNDQWFVNVGFCLDRLSDKEPNRIECAHMYFRLERLFPQYRESILGAGHLSDLRQPEAYKSLLMLCRNEIALGLRKLGTEHGLVEAYHSGKLNAGLVTKPASELLSSVV